MKLFLYRRTEDIFKLIKNPKIAKTNDIKVRDRFKRPASISFYLLVVWWYLVWYESEYSRNTGDTETNYDHHKHLGFQTK
jgi:hypothetical protein